MNLTRTDLLAFVSALVLVSGWHGWSNFTKKEAPATDWFTVRNINVPDFIEGSDPPVIYDRVIKKEFTATWAVEIHGTTQSTNYAICSGSGTNHYEPTEALPDAGISLSWFLGPEAWQLCDLKEGQYTLQVSYEIRPPGYPPKQYAATSNIFRVAPMGAQLYVTPEQTRTLREIQQ